MELPRLLLLSLLLLLSFELVKLLLGFLQLLLDGGLKLVEGVEVRGEVVEVREDPREPGTAFWIVLLRFG
jgi:hypothetical protein